MTQTRTCHRLSGEMVDGLQLVLSDLDGCLVSEGRAFADAVTFVDTCAERLWIVSNNSTHSATSLSSELALLGLHVPAARILLAGEQTLRHLSETRPGAELALFASDCLRAQARDFGLRIDSENPEFVVLCRDPRFTIVDLERLIGHLDGGARLWVSNLDRSHPSMEGRPVPETGALLAALKAVLGEIAFDCIGKPHPHMVRQALARAHASTQEAIFVGDNAATDGIIARAAGIRFAHLLRGQAA